MQGMDSNDFNREDSRTFIRSIFALFCLFSLFIVPYVFYGEEVRTRLENDLFDIRSRLKPQIADTSKIALVTVNQQDILFLEDQNSQTLKYSTLKKIISAIDKSKPEATILLIPRQDLDYDSQKFLDFIKEIRKIPSLYFGSYDLNYFEPTESMLPPVFEQEPRFEFAAGTLRRFKREVVRTLPLKSYRDKFLENHIVNQVALNHSLADEKVEISKLNQRQLNKHKNAVKKSAYWDTPRLPRIRLNYIVPEQFLTLKSSTLMMKQSDEKLTGKIVLLGYTAYRKRTYEFRDGTLVNTPWEGDENKEALGTPLIYPLAIQLQNLLQLAWLEDQSVWYNFFQTLFVTIISFLIWNFVPSVAVTSFCLLILILLYIHGFLFSYLNFYIPLADTILFSIFANIAGAFLSLSKKGKQALLRERKSQSLKRLAIIQSHFLNRFAFELFENNSKINKILTEFRGELLKKKPFQDVYIKALGSCKDLGEFLSGIKKYANFTEGKNKKIRRKKLKLSPMIERILNQFESMIDEANLFIEVDCPDNLWLWTDQLFLEPILFNFISNAVKYSFQGGAIKIGAKYSFYNKVSVYVEDEGPGIDAIHREKIFHKFYRVKNDLVYKIKGNGLGLFLSHYFAKKLSAKIEVQSQTDRGSTFILTVEGFRR